MALRLARASLAWKTLPVSKHFACATRKSEGRLVEGGVLSDGSADQRSGAESSFAELKLRPIISYSQPPPRPVVLCGAVLEARKRSRQSLSGTSQSRAETAPAPIGRMRVF